MTLDSGAWVIIAASPISSHNLILAISEKESQEETKKEGQEEPPFLKVRPI